MITILLQKMLDILSLYFSGYVTKLESIKENIKTAKNSGLKADYVDIIHDEYTSTTL